LIIAVLPYLVEYQEIICYQLQKRSLYLFSGVVYLASQQTGVCYFAALIVGSQYRPIRMSCVSLGRPMMSGSLKKRVEIMRRDAIVNLL
jgi:hypothetical protein